MTSSMTGFVSQQVAFQGGVLICEIRSVNHRFLDLHFRLPESLRSLEVQFRDKIKATLKRGKVDLSLKWQASEENDALVINQKVLNSLLLCCKQVADMMPDVTTSALDVLRWPGMMDRKRVEGDDLNAAALQLVDSALEQMAAQRKREGATIQAFMQGAIRQVRQYREKVKQQMPVFLRLQREQFLQKLNQLSVELDYSRIEQEIVLLVQKSDVAEELQRLDAHLNETESVLMSQQVMGRRLDFMMQELNREVNTIASKSSDVVVTQAAVEMKVQIEQMREQVQNIE